MTIVELQEWLGAHGQPVSVSGVCDLETQEALSESLINKNAPAVDDADVTAIADRLGCTVKQIHAVAQVECSGSAFDVEGRPKMLFERHLFDRFTSGRCSPSVFSDPTPGGYNIDSLGKLTQAVCCDVQAAFAATSWGKFQVLGAHADGRYHGFLDLGYASPLDMAYSAVISEAGHYEMLARYIEKTGLGSALRQLSTNPDSNRAFALGYNGPHYERFSYHLKLAKAMA